MTGEIAANDARIATIAIASLKEFFNAMIISLALLVISAAGKRDSAIEQTA
ncbi:hypothetical protein [Streptomyces glaucescens]|jgi:hypothetical protein|uniref:hypothetical protein n=1 Tax=Streptomyces glaucescens TaxID=1907 RepID=UPI0013027453|nr:hypothetical protein [Streptomyces glaucescens]